MSAPAAPGAGEIAAAIRDGRMTAEAAMRACLDRVSEREPEVLAWEWIDPDRALRLARAADAGPVRGPLHGVPVAVKDLIDTADMPTGYGSKIHAGHRPDRDAACVALLRAAGAIPLGKTVTTEFATFTPGKTRNPHDAGHTPGGSSSGSAAAVAAGMVPLALGTQTVGSVVRPAAFCGVVGLKPSRGSIPTGGVKPLAPGFDTVGCFARSVGDVALCFAAMTGAAPASPSPTPPRIALVRTPHWQAASDETRATVERAAERLAGAGATVSDTALADGALDGVTEAQDTLFAAEARQALAAEYEGHRDWLSPALVALLERGGAVTPAERAAAETRAGAARREMDRVWADWDLVLAPAAPGTAPEGLGSTGDPLFNRIWTLLLGPCMALPAGSGRSGLPLAVQFAGPPGQDAAVLAAALWAERALGA